MNNDEQLQRIKNRLSLREPLQEALDIVAQLSDDLTLNKVSDNEEEALAFLKSELDKVQHSFTTCTNFQRDFPSIAFSIATGVGKTRLMGACIAYLYLQKGIKNFFILAPNLTIYDKLIEDFGNPAYHKYVFNGISEFVHNRPVIITGDNYNQQGNLFKEGEIRINIFNISKFNSDNKGQKKDGISLAPKIKRLSEYLGQSYWEYLSGIQDLVILMDEAHRYHADASKNAINELKPILGLELTATPFDEKGQQFKNIVYEYSLAKALVEGKYVKNPAIATRKNFKRGDLSDKEVEIIKLEDAVSIHQDTKIELEIYSKNNDVKLVKPFILVVCRDITHAREVYDLINSDVEPFYEGEYRGKVLQIDSSTKKEEEIEKQFLSLESSDNEIEIVIHFNMLKEGWDVTNLYTIVPLRAANAAILIEQTIGRGLRLPFDGKRTGVDSIDKLTVIAHDNFEAVLAAAKDPNSVLNKMSFIEIPEENLGTKTEVITSKSITEIKLEEEQVAVNKIENVANKQKAQNSLDAKNILINVFNEPQVIYKTKGLNINSEKTEEIIINAALIELDKGQQSIFRDEIAENIKTELRPLLTNHFKNIIQIPRIDLAYGEVIATFNHFDLDTSELNYHALEQEIIRMGLMDKSVETLKAKSSGSYGNPVKNIISELINFTDVDYDDNADLLYHLANQAYNSIKDNVDDGENISQIMFQFKSTIANKIYLQMKDNFTLTRIEKAPNVLPFARIEQWNFSVLVNAGYKDYREVVVPTIMVPKYVFRGFEKACHFEYKFDSKTEQDLAFVLENDKKVIKWLRPAANQFRIYWDNNSKRYEPDFIIETEDTIYMVEPKSSANMNDADVLAKKEAAIKYCKYATEFTSQNKGKSWKYLLVPHNEISRTINFDLLIAKFS